MKNLDAALDKIAQRMDGEVKVGFMAGSVYPETGTPVAAVAFWNEYGVPSNGTPPRPFFRNMIAKESKSWPGKLAKAVKHADYDGDTALSVVGADIRGALQDSIRSLSSPALSPVTLILRERFGNQPHNITFGDVMDARRAAAEGETGATGTQAHPLIWTGHLLNSVTYKVS